PTVGRTRDRCGHALGEAPPARESGPRGHSDAASHGYRRTRCDRVAPARNRPPREEPGHYADLIVRTSEFRASGERHLMAEASSTNGKSFLSLVRTTLAVSGVIMLVLGLFILVWPTKTALFFAGVIAVYLIVQGLVYIGTGVFSRSDGGWSRLGHVVLGVLYVVGGALAFVNLFAFTATLVLFIGIMLGITWI